MTAISRKIIKQIELEARKYFKKASGCHDWTHVERVRVLSLFIGRREKADLGVLELAAILHDVGREQEMKSKGAFCHAEKSAEIAKNILAKYNISQEAVSNIIHCIKTHRFRNSRIPGTIEAKVLFDADKLDSIGAVGLARAFLFAGSVGSGNLYTGNEKKLSRLGKDFSFTKEDSAVLEYELKLKHIKDKILTSTGKKIAGQRHKFMTSFFKRFWQEIKGNK